MSTPASGAPWVRIDRRNMALTWGNGEIVESRYDYRYAMAPGHVGCMTDQVDPQTPVAERDHVVAFSTD